MGEDTFKFKQFEVIQRESVMKITTDSIIVASWADCAKAKSILDIGAGTGIISLILAQKNNTAIIHAIEIDLNTYQEAKQNFENSKWSNRLKVINIPIQDYTTETKYDLIISNPPFFDNKVKSINRKNNLSKHTFSLNFDELLDKTRELLSDNGRAVFIIPFEEKDRFIAIAMQRELFLSRIKNIKGRENTEIKRTLLEFSTKQGEIYYEDILIIETNRHTYTDEYKDYTKDFYLNM